MFLHGVIELGADPERAYDDVLKVWQPNAVWNRFVRDERHRRGLPLPLGVG